MTSLLVIRLCRALTTARNTMMFGDLCHHRHYYLYVSVSQNVKIITSFENIFFYVFFFSFAFARRRSRVWIELMPFNGIIIGLCLCSDIENSQPSQQSVVVYKNARRCIYNRHSPANICGCSFRVYIYLFGRVTHTGTMWDIQYCIMDEIEKQ